MKKILFLDDDHEMHHLMKFVFDPRDYEVTSISRGEPVMNLEIELPDLFLLDKSLSGMDGLDVCRFLKANEKTRQIPVLMLSASPDIKNTARLAGADDALEKPFKKKELLETVSKYLG